MADWRGAIEFLGGSEEAEARILAELGALVTRQVAEISQTLGPPQRPQHAKTLATPRAQFVVADDLAPDLRVGFFVPGRRYPALLRFSNAGALVVPDRENDLRGLAVKIDVGTSSHDLLGTNAELHHARNAVEALWASYSLYRPGPWAKVRGIAALMGKVGIPSALRIVKTLAAQLRRPLVSLATDTFWSRSPFRFGEVVVRFRIRAALDPQPVDESVVDLGAELVARCRQGPVVFLVEGQRYVDEARTPLEDSTRAWSTPFEPLGSLVIPQGEIPASPEGLTFSPWNVAGPEFEPLGNMNRARKVVYAASQRARGASS